MGLDAGISGRMQGGGAAVLAGFFSPWSVGVLSGLSRARLPVCPSALGVTFLRSGVEVGVFIAGFGFHKKSRYHKNSFPLKYGVPLSEIERSV